MNATYKNRNGEDFEVSLCCIDSGDQTEDVYDFCYKNGDWAIPVKGSSHQMYSRYKISTIEKIGSKAFGMRLVLINTSQYKEVIANRLKRPNGNGSFMVFSGCDLDYAQQITSEHKVRVKKGSSEVEVWKPKTAHADNHYLDCEVYACTAADLLNVRYLEEIEEKYEPEIPQKEQQVQNNGGWFNKGGWI